MTTNGDTPRRTDEEEPFEQLFAEVFGLVDETVARITDIEVDEHLRRILGQAGRGDQLADEWREYNPDRCVQMPGFSNSMEAARATAAEVIAAAQLKAKQSDEQLRRAREAVNAARQQAGKIIADAHEEADKALEQAAKMVRDAREQAERIITDAHADAQQLAAAAQNRHARQADNVSSAKQTRLSGAAAGIIFRYLVGRGKDDASTVTVADVAEGDITMMQLQLPEADVLPFAAGIRFFAACQAANQGQELPGSRQRDLRELALWAEREVNCERGASAGEIPSERVRTLADCFGPAVYHLTDHASIERPDESLADGGSKLPAPSTTAGKIAAGIAGVTGTAGLGVFAAALARIISAHAVPAGMWALTAGLVVVTAAAIRLGLTVDHRRMKLMLKSAADLEKARQEMYRAVLAKSAGEPASARSYRELFIGIPSAAPSADDGGTQCAGPVSPFGRRSRSGQLRRAGDRPGVGAVQTWRHLAKRGLALHGDGPGSHGSGFYSEHSKQRSQLLNGENCTVLLADVVAFGARTRNDEDRRMIREALFDMTHATLQEIPDVWSWDDRGDGLLIVIPPSVPTANVIERLVRELPTELGRHNSAHRESARIQLRVAVNVGPVASDTMGVSGEAIIVSARLVEAPVFKEAIAKSSASLGIIASSFVYESVIRHTGDPISLAAYSQIQVDVKESSMAAWMKLITTVVPGYSPLADPVDGVRAR